LASHGLLEAVEASAVLTVALASLKDEAALTVDMARDTSATGAEILRRLLFCHLAPLLALKTVPCRSWAELRCSGSAATQAQQQQQLTDELVCTLQRKVLSPLEFQEVKRLASELLGRLPHTESLVEDALLSVLTDRKRALDPAAAAEATENDACVAPEEVAKAYVFSLCHMIATRDKHAFEAGAAPVPHALESLVAAAGLQTRWADRIVSYLLGILLLPSDAHRVDSELYKLQRGCIDALSFMVEAEVAGDGGVVNDKVVDSSNSIAAAMTPHTLRPQPRLIVEIDTTTPAAVPTARSPDDSVMHSLILIIRTARLPERHHAFLSAVLPAIRPPSVRAAPDLQLLRDQSDSAVRDALEEALFPVRVCAINVFISMSQRVQPERFSR
jgi:hypothetical protein